MEREHDLEVQCPTCWETNPVVLDAVEGTQTFVEDCWVCCRPMTIRCVVAGDEVISAEVEPAD
jgi:hypothetical protein